MKESELPCALSPIQLDEDGVDLMVVLRVLQCAAYKARDAKWRTYLERASNLLEAVIADQYPTYDPLGCQLLPESVVERQEHYLPKDAFYSPKRRSE